MNSPDKNSSDKKSQYSLKRSDKKSYSVISFESQSNILSQSPKRKQQKKKNPYIEEENIETQIKINNNVIQDESDNDNEIQDSFDSQIEKNSNSNMISPRHSALVTQNEIKQGDKIFDNYIKNLISKEEEFIDLKIKEQSEALIQLMRKKIKNKVENHFIFKALTSLKIFEKSKELMLQDEFQGIVNKSFKMQNYKKYQTIFELGDLGVNYYIVLRGCVNCLVPEIPTQLQQDQDESQKEDGPTKNKSKQQQKFRESVQKLSLGNKILQQLQKSNSSSDNQINSKFDLRVRRYSRLNQNDLIQPHSYKLSCEDYLKKVYPLLKLVGKYKEGEGFGEIALLTKQRRSATMVCDEDTVCLILNKQSYDQIMGKFQKQKLDHKIDFFEQYDFIKNMGQQIRMLVINNAQEITLKHGEYLYSEDDQLDYIYFISEGGIEYSCLKEESLTQRQEREEEKWQQRSVLGGNIQKEGVFQKENLKKKLIYLKDWKNKQNQIRRVKVCVLGKGSYFGEEEYLQQQIKRKGQAIVSTSEVKLFRIELEYLMNVLKQNNQFELFEKQNQKKQSQQNQKVEKICQVIQQVKQEFKRHVQQQIEKKIDKATLEKAKEFRKVLEIQKQIKTIQTCFKKQVSDHEKCSTDFPTIFQIETSSKFQNEIKQFENKFQGKLEKDNGILDLNQFSQTKSRQFLQNLQSRQQSPQKIQSQKQIQQEDKVKELNQLEQENNKNKKIILKKQSHFRNNTEDNLQSKIQKNPEFFLNRISNSNSNYAVTQCQSPSQQNSMTIFKQYSTNLNQKLQQIQQQQQTILEQEDIPIKILRSQFNQSSQDEDNISEMIWSTKRSQTERGNLWENEVNKQKKNMQNQLTLKNSLERLFTHSSSRNIQNNQFDSNNNQLYNYQNYTQLQSLTSRTNTNSFFSNSSINIHVNKLKIQTLQNQNLTRMKYNKKMQENYFNSKNQQNRVQTEYQNNPSTAPSAQTNKIKTKTIVFDNLLF